METATQVNDTSVMTEDESEYLFERAVALAHQTFEGADDKHVTGMYSRLIWNRLHGLQDEGACTVH